MIREDHDGAPYPGGLETFCTTRTGLRLFLRPIKATDGPLIEGLMHGLSDESLYARFFTRQREVPYQLIPELAAVDYSRAMAIAAVNMKDEAPQGEFLGVGRYHVNPRTNTALLSIAVRDDFHNQGIGQALLSYLSLIARHQGLLGFTAAVLAGNKPVLRILEQGGFEIRKQPLEGIVMLNMMFRKPGDPLSFSP